MFNRSATTVNTLLEPLQPLARLILWFESLILTGITLAFWFPTPTRTDWLWVIWLLVPLLVARTICYRRVITRTPLDLYFVVFMILGVINVYAAPYTRGLMMLARPLLGIALYYALVERTRITGSLHSAVQVIILLSLLLGIHALGATQWSGKSDQLRFLIDLMPTVRNPTAEGGFNVNEIAGAVAWVLPFTARIAAYRWRVRGIRWDVTLAFVMLFLGIILGQSRSAIAGVVVGLFLVSLFTLRGLWRLLAWGLLIGIIALEVVLITDGLAQAPQTDAAGEVALARDEESAVIRLDIWSSALAIIRDYPFNGVGLSMFRDGRVRERYPVPSMEGKILPHTHNEILQITSDMGLPGLLVFISIHVVAAWMLFRAWRSGDEETRAVSVAVAAGLLAHAIFGLTDAITLWDRFGFMLWLMLGVAGAVYTHAMYHVNLKRESPESVPA